MNKTITAWTQTLRYRRTVAAFVLIAGYAVVFLAACAYQSKSTGTAKQETQIAIEGEHCSIFLTEEDVQDKAITLTAGLTNSGKTAICSDYGASKKTKLLMIASPEECLTDKGIKKADDVFSNYIVQVPRRDGIVFNSLSNGKMSCQDSNRLAGGGFVEIRAPLKQEPKETRPTIVLATADEIIGINNFDIVGINNAEIIGISDPETPSNFLDERFVEFACVMNEFHTNAVYGRWFWGGVDDPSLFLVCDPNAPAEESFICATPTTGRRIAIIGNDRANDIRPAIERIPCGAGNTIEVGPPSRYWSIEELWIVGWGGEDTLRGVDDGGTTNVIFGDYLCGLPVDETGEYVGVGGGDTIYGGPGDDRLFGEEGDDTIRGGEGNDDIVGAGPCHGYPPDVDFIRGGIGDDKIWGDSTVTAAGLPAPGDSSAELLTGGRDTIFGMAGDDTILGGPGNDEIFGDAYDWAETPEGDDNICGEAGADRIHPGPGCDEIFTDSEDNVVGDQLPCDFVSATDCPWE